MPESRNARCLSYSASKYRQRSSVMFRLACKDLRVPASFLMVPVLELGVKKQCVCSRPATGNLLKGLSLVISL